MVYFDRRWPGRSLGAIVVEVRCQENDQSADEKLDL